MGISIIGLIICAALAGLGHRFGAPLIIGLFASLAFGGTAIGRVGGATPLIFTAFEIALASLLAVRLNEIWKLLTREYIPWVVLILTVYVVAGSIIMPRLFAGEIVIPIGASATNIVQTLLVPTSKNFNQAGYFVLAASMYFIFKLLLQRRETFRHLALAFLIFAGLHAALGMIDLVSKLAGITDILAPVRTAGYLSRSAEAVGGFWRVVGAYPEASGYSSIGVQALAFCVIYWRTTGDNKALAIALTLLFLLVISTSTTAYVALAILSVPLALMMIVSFFRDSLHVRDASVIGATMAGVIIFACIVLSDPRVFDTFANMIDTVVFSKVTSASALERSFWNEKSMDAFFDTFGLGIGIGSGRASSWVVAVLAQLGVFGALLLAFLVSVILFGMTGLRMTPENRDIFAVVNGIRAASIASLVTNSFIGGTSDPGVIFFTALAAVGGGRYLVQQRAGDRAVQTIAPGWADRRRGLPDSAV